MKNKNTNTELNIDYKDVNPIYIRDPVAEALTVLDKNEPFIITYSDVVKAAGHSCPTASGAFRITQLGLDKLYPSEYPVRGKIKVLAYGSMEDESYGVMSRIISYITGASGKEGFSGLKGGYGNRKDYLEFREIETDGITFAFKRTDTNDTVEVTYNISQIPPSGSSTKYLSKILDGNETIKEREAFSKEWHNRVQTILKKNNFFTIKDIEKEF